MGEGKKATRYKTDNGLQKLELRGRGRWVDMTKLRDNVKALVQPSSLCHN